MHHEAAEAAGAVQRLLERNAAAMTDLGRHLRASPPLAVMTLARGSSDNACTYGRYLIENGLGVVGASIGLSAGSIYATPLHANGTLCIAVSQSGASPDLLSSVRRAKTGGALVVGMVNQPGSPLAAECDIVIDLAAGLETSVAATKSYIASAAALAWLAAEWRDDSKLRTALHDLPHRLNQAWNLDWSPVSDILQSATNMYVLGRGPGLGTAQEVALKLKETCALHAEAFSSAEVVHGPMALVAPGFPILAFAQDDASRATSEATVADMIGRGARVFCAGAQVDGALSLPVIRSHPSLEPILMTLPFYRAAADLSVARGLDPDNPPHLSKVTRTH